MGTNDDGTPPNRPLDRRLFVFRTLTAAASVAMVGPVVVAATTTNAEAQRCTDRDPSDGVGRGRRCRRPSCTDRDPQDGVGRGRRCGPRRRCTDSDPRDGVGRGRRC
jgi:hypothetical protein